MIMETIDAVITWVDGNDIAHQKKRAHYLKKNTLEQQTAATPTRFNQRGEINWCIQSILHFAPWIRTIHLVTDAQTPPIATELQRIFPEKIHMVDHREIFHAHLNALPTFNSLSIETMLTNITGLAKRFIYFNDDCILIRPVSPQDFFQNDHIILRGYWKKQTHRKLQKRLFSFLKEYLPIPRCKTNKIVNLHRQVQENSAFLAEYHTHFFHLPHEPFPIQQQTLQNFYKKHPDLITRNIAHTFRHPSQFWPISLAHHLEIKSKHIIRDNTLRAISFNGAYHTEKKIMARLKKAETDPNMAFLCMQSLDLVSEETWTIIKAWLNQKIRILPKPNL